MGSIYDWSTTASDNGAADATVNFAENQTPASLNNSARAVMARVAAWLKGLGAAITHGGSSNAYTLTLSTGHTITAYATGMRFLWKPNGTSSGSVTLNVDGVGAKKVYLPSGTQAGSGHITSGTLLDVVYDATLDSAAGGFQIVGSSSSLTAQPLDATLTALAALSYGGSGNQLVQMTAADTVSLTLTPSVSSISTSQGAAATTPSATFVNTNDSSGVRVLRLEGDRATPANNDNIYGSFYISNLSGTQTEVARIRCLATDLTAGSEDARIDFLVAINGAMTATLVATGTNLSPNTSDGMALGNTSQMWSDLFLASGAVLNFNNGGVTLTHDATNDRLVLAAGALKARPAISTDTGGTLTSASDNCIVDLATAPTINDGIHEAGSIIVLVNNTASSMTITQDTGMTLRLHGTATTGNRTLAARGIATVQIDPASNAEALVTGDVS